MKRRYKQLTYEERIQIDSLRNQGFSIRRIAQELKRSPNTISRELQEKKVKGIYIPKKAQHKTYWKRYMSKKDCMKVAMNKEICNFVLEKTKESWSPERISGYLRNKDILVSTKAIYKYIYSRCLDHHLFWKKNKKRTGRKKYSHTLKISRNFIEQRPVCENTGHLEADFIVSSHSPWCLLVVVDRWSRYVWIERIPNRKHLTVSGAFQRIVKDMKVKSITVDNDIAFLKWMQLEEELHTKIFFTHPYCSWEKGLVENTNRWIRCFVRKRRDIGTVSQKELQKMQTFLNTVPRKVIGFRSAKEVLYGSEVS